MSGPKKSSCTTALDLTRVGQVCQLISWEAAVHIRHSSENDQVPAENLRVVFFASPTNAAVTHSRTGFTTFAGSGQTPRGISAWADVQLIRTAARHASSTVLHQDRQGTTRRGSYRCAGRGSGSRAILNSKSRAHALFTQTLAAICSLDTGFTSLSQSVGVTRSRPRSAPTASPHAHTHARNPLVITVFKPNPERRPARRNCRNPRPKCRAAMSGRSMP